MSKLLLDWLNFEVKLSREVVLLEEDFKNGYLLGELLHLHNQQSKFEKFIDKDFPDAKIVNFCLLEPTMRQIGVFFNSKVAFEIMNGKRGVMKTMLYEIKIALDSVKKRSTLLPNKSSTGPKILRVIQPIRPAYDKTLSETFQNAIRVLMENPNDVMMNNVTRKFQVKMDEFRQSVSLGYSMQLSAIDNEVQQVKKVDQYRRSHDKEFMDAWEIINTRKWKENQNTAKKRKELIQKVKSEETRKVESRILWERNAARDKAVSNINEFDERLRTEVFREDPKNKTSVALSIKTIAAQPEKGLPKLSYLDRNSLKTAMIETQKAMKEHHEDLTIRQQVHGRRQRKFIRERESFHTEHLLNNAEADIINQLLNPCASEQLETHVRSRVMLHKSVIKENRLNRERITQQREAYDMQLQKDWEAEEAMREYHWIVKPRIYAQRDRLEAYEIAHSSASRKQSLETVAETIDRLLDLTDWVVSCRQVGMFVTTEDKSILPEEIWTDVLTMFTTPLAIATALPLPHPINVSLHLPNCLSERPLCSEAEWLYQQPLDSHLALKYQNNNQKKGSEIDMPPLESRSSNSDNNINPNSTIKNEEEDYTVKLIANELADLDCQNFITSVANPSITDEELSVPSSERLGRPTSAAVIAVPNVPDDPNIATKATEVLVVPPQWMTNTSCNYMLGETIINIRAVTFPIPEDPSPTTKLPKCYIKIALCGICNVTRAVVAERLSTSLGLQTIRIESLLRKAISIGEQAIAKPKESLSSLEAAAIAAYSGVRQGSVVESETYVTLLLEELACLNNKRGYVIEDFPSSRSEARLFLHALSGIDYDSVKPDVLDQASVWALPSPKEPEGYDVSKCGLDAVFFLESDAENLVVQKFGERTDLRTQEKVYVDDSPRDSVKYLSCIKEPTKPKEMFAVGLTMSLDAVNDLQDFLYKLKILHVIPIRQYGTIEEAAENIEIVVSDMFADVIATLDADEDDDVFPIDTEEVRGAVTDVEKVSPKVPSLHKSITYHEQSTSTPLRSDPPSLRSSVSLSARSIHSILPQNSNHMLDELKDFANEHQKGPPTDVISVNAIPKPLADILHTIWLTSENQSKGIATTFFRSMRDLRYEMLQRRRAVFDTIQALVIKRDDRQALFEKFRFNFNVIEDDFRFDPECIAELHLRTQELRTKLWSMTEQRKKEGEAIVKKVANDGICGLFIHRCQCEGAALLQSEVNRFIASLHLLQDVFFFMQKFNQKEKYCNLLEEALPLPVDLIPSPSNKSLKPPKSRDKERKAAESPVKSSKKMKQEVLLPNESPFRPPLSPAVFLQEFVDIPETDVDDDDEGAAASSSPSKAKAKGKTPAKTSKKVAVEEAVKIDPLTQAVNTVTDLLESWSQGCFIINRTVYGGDETFCSILEKSIWFEANRLKCSLQSIQSMVAKQCAWLLRLESELIQNMRHILQTRQRKELSTIERLIVLIQEAIEENLPITSEWLLTNDALAVRKQYSVLPAKPTMPIPKVIEFPANRLNNEQIEVAHNMLKSLQVGRVILEEDLKHWISMCENPIGPLSNANIANGKLVGFTMPKLWREDIEEINNSVLSVVKVAGVDELSGVIPLETVISSLQVKVMN